MNIKQNTLAALLVLGIGMSGCNNSDNNPTPSTDNKAVDGNKTVDQNNTEENRTTTILGYIGSQHSNHNSTITVAQLQEITPALENINADYENIYQRYIASADSNFFSSPATRGEVQSMINEVNDFNLPEHAILDRSFFKKTNGVFEHRFVYLAVENNTTGRTWLNNNLGAEHANVDSSHYSPSQQATSLNDYLAYGSLFQWGRKADGHELINWTGKKNGTKKYGHTSTKSNDPSNSLYIISSNDWRVTSDDTLWASESGKNNVCPVGYRLPLNPNGANDSENEFYIETQTWRTKDPSGAYRSVLKMPISGYRNHFNGNVKQIGAMASYWSGSPANTSAHSMDFYPDIVYPNEISPRTYGFNVRCIKDQTPAERSDSILLEIGNEHSKQKSVITIAQLKAITPALENINNNYESSYRAYIASADNSFSSPTTRDEVQRMIDEINSLTPASENTLALIATQHSSGSSDITVTQLKAILPALENVNDNYENIYRTYIASADTNIGSPATIEEVQHMIDQVNSLNLPEHAILDRSFFKRTNGTFEHRFVYLPVTNSTTGKIWLNNNLGADYANVDSSAYNASHQATAIDDRLAYGSLFQWGRKADGHELINWTEYGTKKYGHTFTKSNEPGICIGR